MLQIGIKFINIQCRCRIIVQNYQQNMKQPLLQDPSLKHIEPYRHGEIRFLALILLAFVLFANQYTFNNPQALQDSIQQQLGISESKFNLLYTYIAFPNIFFAFFLGVIIDYFGIRITFLVMTLGLPLFQIIVAFGGVYHNFPVMLVGRFLFGIVNQSLQIAQAVYVSYWFMGKQLALALGLAVTLPQLGDAFNSYITPIIYEKTQSLGPPLFTSVGICFIAFVCACLMTYLDMRADEVDQKNNLKVITDTQQTDSQMTQTINCSDFKQLKSTYWLIASLCMFSMAQYVPFLDNANKLFQVRFCFSQVTAGKNITITYVVVAAFGLPIGLLVDKFGFKRYFIIAGMVIFAIGQAIILLTPQCAISDIITQWSAASWGLFLIGIGYCFYANCLMPSIPLVVNSRVTGTAFGIMGMLENIAQALYLWISGSVIQHAPDIQSGYLHSSMLYVVSGLSGVLVSLLLLFINQKDKIKLDASSAEKVIRKVKIHSFQTDIQKKIGRNQHQANQVLFFSDYTDKDHAPSQQDLQVKRKSLKIQLQLFKSNLANKESAKSEKSLNLEKKTETKNKKTQKLKKNKYMEKEFNDYNYASQEDNDIKFEKCKKIDKNLEIDEKEKLNQEKQIQIKNGQQNYSDLQK